MLLRQSILTHLLTWSLVSGIANVFDARADESISYEYDVRPILKTHCFHCHGEGGELFGGLDLRLRRLIVSGGESGTSLVPGQPDESLLLQRLVDGDMPPEEVSLRPSQTEVDLIEKWIATGANTHSEEPDDLSPDNYITAAERDYWAFQPIADPEPPAIDDMSRVRNGIDQFIQAKLSPLGLSVAEQADDQTLVRRVYLDMHGLPPTPAEVDAFVLDRSPNRFDRLLDRVLGSPRYGERWGRHWLDVAGYADSEGYTEDDPIRSDAYKYRDYVIDAINRDKPFDRFVIEQLAGDQLVPQPWKNLTAQQAELLTATGFLRMAPDGTASSAVDPTIARNDVVAKTIEITSSALLGLSVGCAQCHDHRYDPISQRDYYALRAIFEPALDCNDWKPPSKRRVSLYTEADHAKAAEIEKEAKAVLDKRSKKQTEYIEQTLQKELAKLDQDIRQSAEQAYRTPVKERTPEQKSLLAAHPSVNVSAGSLYLYDKSMADALKKMADQAAAIRAKKPKQEFVRALWEPAGKTPPKTHLFSRGDPTQPTDEINPAPLTVLTSIRNVEIPLDDPSRPTTGRRLAYAQWLTSGEHPLLARVIVNRIWMNHFGKGLVRTPDEFGNLGTAPSHPLLLDYLASRFVEGGWSVKRLHRLIMTSATYRQSSQRHPDADAQDPENHLYARMSVRRLEAEAIRDAALSISGELNSKFHGPPVPVMADRVGQFVIGKENLNAGRPGEVLPMHGEDLRRSVYVQVRRSRPLGVLEPFDLPRMEPNCASRASSTVSPQALLMMNSQFVVDRAAAFANRLRRDAGDDVDAQIKLAWRLAFARHPTAQDLEAAKLFIGEQSKLFADNPNQSTALFCQALLSSNQFLYVD